jgi:glycosyltransferase involved in cell wall biosynthesis
MAACPPMNESLAGVKVCLATSGHNATDDRIFFKEARSLAKTGAEVILLCARGKKHPEHPDGVRVLNYDGGGGLKERLTSIAKLEQALGDLACDVVLCHEPDSLVAALRVKRRTGVKVIFDSHELWAGSWAGRFPRPLWPLMGTAYRLLERRWLAQCDAAIGASRAITDYLAETLGPERVETILNVPVVDVFGEIEPAPWGEVTTICHEGHLTFARGLKTMVRAIRRVRKHHPVVLKIVGDVYGPEREWLEAYVERHGLEEAVVRTGWLPYREVGRAIAPCQIGIIGFQPHPNHWIAAPNKCFNYLLYGQPVIGPDFPHSHFAILAREGCAVLADSESPDAYAAAINQLVADRAATSRMAATARRLSQEKYRWEHMEPILFDLVRRVVSAR